MRPLTLLLLAGATGVLTACSPIPLSSLTHDVTQSEHISKDTDSDGAWPVSPAGGTLTCNVSKGGAITFTPDGDNATYALNAPAIDRASEQGWQNFRDIWLDDPDPGASTGLKINDGYFMEEGQKLCDWASSTPTT